MVAFSPLANPAKAGSGLLQDEVVTRIAAKHGASAAQVVLGWNLKRGVTIVPHSRHPDEIRENIDARSLSLDEEDIEELDALTHRVRTLAFDWLPFEDDTL